MPCNVRPPPPLPHFNLLKMSSSEVGFYMHDFRQKRRTRRIYVQSFRFQTNLPLIMECLFEWGTTTWWRGIGAGLRVWSKTSGSPLVGDSKTRYVNNSRPFWNKCLFIGMVWRYLLYSNDDIHLHISINYLHNNILRNFNCNSCLCITFASLKHSAAFRCRKFYL